MPLLSRYESILLKRQVTGYAPYWPRVSEALAIRLHNEIITRSAHLPIPSILDELSSLDGVPDTRQTSTKPAELMEGPLLGRFMHKHYTCTAFMLKNLQNQWMGPYAEKRNMLAELIEGVIPAGTVTADNKQAWQQANRLADEIVVGGYQRRTRRRSMTGEWIIYYVHQGLNYYLDLAWHCETKTPEGEQALYDRLQATCAWEFPFAFE